MTRSQAIELVSRLLDLKARHRQYEQLGLAGAAGIVRRQIAEMERQLGKKK